MSVSPQDEGRRDQPTPMTKDEFVQSWLREHVGDDPTPAQIADAEQLWFDAQAVVIESKLRTDGWPAS